MDNDMHEYRAHLVSAAHKSIEVFDKTLVSLSGGALAISIVFVNDVIGDSPIESRRAIVIAWCCWVASLAMTLISLYTSYLGLNKAIHQVDTGNVQDGNRGGLWHLATQCFNIVSGALFIIGVAFMIWFAQSNFEVTCGKETVPASPAANQATYPEATAAATWPSARAGGESTSYSGTRLSSSQAAANPSKTCEVDWTDDEIRIVEEATK